MIEDKRLSSMKYQPEAQASELFGHIGGHSLAPRAGTQNL